MSNNVAALPATVVAGAASRPAVPPRIGMFPPFGLLERDPHATGAFLEQVSAAGIDHICCADHVSFFAGLGFDGLVQATALSMLHPTLPIHFWWPASSPISTSSLPGDSSSGLE